MNEPDGVRARLRAALPAALKARDAGAVAAIRSTLAAIDNAEAVDARAPVVEHARIAGTAGELGAGEAARATLTERQQREVVEREVAERRAAADEYDRHGHDEQAARLRTEADLVASFLVRPA
ncbi:GatB/YqeY domain-containing protein [Conexibacter woesei]|uniref:Uncharacterized protein n=1 Tax=Conexibacter woesei (strain DSM 14684 / CCUG 47730 / CIP 108061 / JCM 11494 / NBRC 100937 / ID131577) TaxID=469383 RepID=D3FB23_CONWI|nr:GatB/YqeY domain-containing protein [Conexibacter woesei]ADB53215.1 conserved hypothetical protein [Conexibacter woesei DSM 14684]